MNCRNFERWIVLSLEGETPPRQKDVLEKHLKGCAACRNVLEDYRNVRHLLAALPMEPVPVLPVFSRTMTEKREKPFPARRRFVLAPAALVVCLLLVIGIIKFRSAPLSVPVQNGSAVNLFAGVSEDEFFDANFPKSTDYRYFIENLSAEEQETFFNILKEM